MKVSIKEIKETRDKIARLYNTTPENAAQIVAQFKDDPQILRNLAANTKQVLSTAKKLKLQLDPETVPQKRSKKNPSTMEKFSFTDEKISIVQGEIIDSDELPPDTADIIEDLLTTWATDNKIDLVNCAGLQWRAACIFVGWFIKRNKILFDFKRIKEHGGTIIYHPNKIISILKIYEYMTSKFRHVPLVTDFISFTGVSQEWFYDTRDALTSSRVDIIKKARAIEEAALSAGLNDHRENPTGRIYYTKARLGWRESTEIIHTTARETQKADILPVFDDLGQVIEEKSALPG